MSQIQLLPHKQEENVVIGENKETGNFLVKIHLLSNVESGNRTTVDYKDISELPESFLNELVGLPITTDHNKKELDKLFDEMEAAGKTDCEIRHALIEKSKEDAVGVLDDIYKPNKIMYNSMMPVTDLTGIMEVTNPHENEYIRKYKRPSRKFTSIGLFGPYDRLPDGREVYRKLNLIRPFHVTLTDNPAFDKSISEFRAICEGSKTDCKKKMMYSSLLEDITADQTGKTTSINTDSNVNNNMSEQNTAIPTAKTTNNTMDVPAPTTKIEDIPKDTRIQLPEGNEPLVPKIGMDTTDKHKLAEFKEPKKEDEKEESEEKVESKNKKEDPALKELEELKKTVNEEKRAWREDIIDSRVSKELFKNEEAFENEKKQLLSTIEKYNMDRNDVKWLLQKAYSQPPAPKKPIYNSMGTTYNSADVTRGYNSQVESSVNPAEDDWKVRIKRGY